VFVAARGAARRTTRSVFAFRTRDAPSGCDATARRADADMSSIPGGRIAESTVRDCARIRYAYRSDGIGPDRAETRALRPPTASRRKDRPDHGRYRRR